MDDQALVQLAKAGDRAAFERLVRLHQNKVLAVAVGLLRDKSAAQDVAQDAFLRAFVHLPECVGSFYGWLYRITVNLCYSRLRAKHQSGVAFHEDDFQSPFDPERALANGEMRSQLQQALGKLPAPLRAVLLLREVDHLSYTELAQTLQWPAGTVMSRLHQARRQLQEMISETQEDPTACP